MKKIFIVLIFAPLFTACTCKKDDGFCTEELRAGLTVAVTLEDLPDILSSDITVIASDRSYTEELRYVYASNINFAGAYERAGTYFVTVSKEGFQTFVSNPIIVSEDKCHVITKNLEIVLKK